MFKDSLLINAFQLDDVDDQAAQLPHWDQEYQQLGCGKFSGSLAYVDLQEFTLIRETSNKALHETVMPPADLMVVGMSMSCENSPTFNGKVFDQNSLLMVDGQRSHDIRTEGHLDLIGISVNRDYFFSRVHEQDASIASDSINSTVTQLQAHLAATLRQYFIYVSQILQGSNAAMGGILTPRMLASSMMSHIALAVSLSNPGKYADTVPRSQQRRADIVQKAIKYMREHASEEIGILDVCAATYVSRRTLQYCFEERLNISPLQYLKTLRLNLARRELKLLLESQVVRERENTIANVAANCGFNHASRFASDYKRLFGELPSKITY